MEKELILVRGGGDIATGVIQKFHRAGFPLLALEAAQPMAIRRTVSLCEAVRSGAATVEDVTARRVETQEEMRRCWEGGEVPLAVDPAGEWIARLSPACVVDAILAKRNLGTRLDMAPVVIALGPGFAAGVDAHAVVETMRGHDLGRLILRGSALPNTGIPGEMGGKSAERVIHAPCQGEIRHHKAIGDVVHKGEAVLQVGDTLCLAPFTGLLRGLIAEMPVKKGTKIADLDPRAEVNWRTISDKARCIGGGVLEAYLYMRNRGRME